MRKPLVEAIVLFGVISLAFYMALLPRLHYPFALHVDEWIHLSRSEWLVESGRATYLDPYSGGRETFAGNLEVGYQAWLGELVAATGLSWISLNRLVTALVLGTISFVAYAWGRRGGFGLEAAFFVVFIHTTNRFLGPAFMVPVALGLLYFPMVLMLLDKYETDWKPFFLIPLAMGGLWLIHGTTAVAVGIVLAIHMAARLLLSPPRHPYSLLWLTTLFVVPATAVVALVLNPRFFRVMISALAGGYRMPLEPIASVVPQFGIIPAVLFLLGIGVLVVRGGWRNYALAISGAILLLYVLMYRRWFAIGPDILYERSWLYAMLLMALVAGYALFTMRQIVERLMPNRRLSSSLAILLVLLVAGLSITYRIDKYQKEYYYRIVGIQRYGDFVFMREKLANQSVVMMDPYVARALPVIAGKYAYQAASSPAGAEVFAMTKKFFDDGATDTQWLTERQIDILYSPVSLKNPDLVGVRHGDYNVYIVREDMASQRVALPGQR